MEANTKDAGAQIDETLNKTEFGHVINDNKKPILILSAVVVIFIVAFSVFRYQSNQAQAQKLDSAFDIQQQAITPYLEGKIEADKAIEELKGIDQSMVGASSLAPGVLEVADKLVEDGKEDASIELLERWLGEFDSSSYLYYFTGIRLAPLYENQGEPKKAISVYEKLVSSSKGVLEPRMYLELGRLYIGEGDTTKAKSFLTHITKNFDTTEEAKFAKMYLQKIGEK